MVPDLSTREQAQQLFFAYYQVCGYKQDWYLYGRNAFTEYIKIDPTPAAREALHEFFSHNNEFDDFLKQMLPNQTDTEYIKLRGARNAFAEHLGYAPPSGHVPPPKFSSPTQNFFAGYDYKFKKGLWARFHL